VAERMLIATGIRINVEDIGAGKPIVLIHGWPVDHRMFEYQLNQLPRGGYRCIAPDLRGFGASDRPWTGYNYDTLADDLRSLLDLLDLNEVTLAGFSMGGAVAIRYLSRHGGARVSQLALLAAAAPCFTRRTGFDYGLDKASVDDLIRQCYADRPAMIAAFGQMLFHQPVSSPFQSWFESLCWAASGHATALCAAELRDADLRPDLAAIHIPTLILHSLHDQVCPFDLALAAQAGIKGAQLVQFDRGGHGFFYEERDRINRELLRFLRQAAPEAQPAPEFPPTAGLGRA